MSLTLPVAFAVGSLPSLVYRSFLTVVFKMKNIINLGLFVGILTCVAAQTTCNTAPAKKDRQYVGPNGVEDPTGGKFCL